MKKDESALLKRRAKLKQVINDGMEKTFPAIFYNAVGRGLARIFRLNKMPPWSVSAFVLGVLVFLPGMLVAIATKEIYRWEEAHLFIIGLGVFTYIGSIVSHISITYNVLPGVRDDLVNSIQSVEDLDDLQSWLGVFWSFRRWMAFTIYAGLIYGIFSTIGLSLSIGSFIGIGLTVGVFSVAQFLAIPFYVIFYMLILPSQLTRYHLNLYESDPANSEIIQRLIYILNVYLYPYVAYVAVATAIASLFPVTLEWWFVYFVMFLGWAPTILQFLVNQYAIRKIIITAKWKNLNRLQVQIKELQNGNLKDAPETTIARINQLMDLHDRISAKPNSILNWGTGLSFLNQLLLPLLGLLLGNIDKLLNLLTRNP